MVKSLGVPIALTQEMTAVQPAVNFEIWAWVGVVESWSNFSATVPLRPLREVATTCKPRSRKSCTMTDPTKPVPPRSRPFVKQKVTPSLGRQPTMEQTG